MKIEIELEEAKRVFFFLEKTHDLLHQPLNFENKDFVTAFADANYAESKALYYNTVWNWLPKQIQEEVTKN